MKASLSAAVAIMVFSIPFFGCASNSDPGVAPKAAPVRDRMSPSGTDFLAAVERMGEALSADREFEAYLSDYAADAAAELKNDPERSGKMSAEERCLALRPRLRLLTVDNMTGEHLESNAFCRLLLDKLEQSGKVRLDKPEGHSSAEAGKPVEKTAKKKTAPCSDLLLGGAIISRRGVDKRRYVMLISYLRDGRTGNLICAKTVDIRPADQAAEKTDSAEASSTFLAEKELSALLAAPEFNAYLSDYAAKAAAKSEMEPAADREMSKWERRAARRPLLVFAGIDNRTPENSRFESAAARILDALSATGKVRVSCRIGRGVHVSPDYDRGVDAPAMNGKRNMRRTPIQVPDLLLYGSLTKRMSAPGVKSYYMGLYLADIGTGELIFANTVEIRSDNRPGKKGTDKPDPCMLMSERLLSNLFSSSDFSSYLHRYAKNAAAKLNGQKISAWDKRAAQRPLLMFHGIENRTGEKFRDLRFVSDRIVETLFRSEMVGISASAGIGGHVMPDGYRSIVRDLSYDPYIRRSREFKKTKQKLRSYELALSGTLIKRQSAPGKTSYLMTLTLIDNSTGEQVWTQTTGVRFDKK